MTDREHLVALILTALAFIAFIVIACIPPRTCTICAQIVPRRKTADHYFDKHQGGAS